MAGRISSGAMVPSRRWPRRERTRVGLVSLAVEQAVDAALDPPPHRLKSEGDQSCCDHRENEVIAHIDQAADAGDDQRVGSHYEARQEQVNQRPADDQVDVEQPVAEDSNRQSHR